MFCRPTFHVCSVHLLSPYVLFTYFSLMFGSTYFSLVFCSPTFHLCSVRPTFHVCSVHLLSPYVLFTYFSLMFGSTYFSRVFCSPTFHLCSVRPTFHLCSVQPTFHLCSVHLRFPYVLFTFSLIFDLTYFSLDTGFLFFFSFSQPVYQRVVQNVCFTGH